MPVSQETLDNLAGGPPPTEQEQRDRTAQAYADQQAGKNPVDEQMKRDDATARAQAEAAAQQKAIDDARRELNNHYQYGGYEGGARDAANYYAWKGDAAENRPGEQINFTDAQGDRYNNLKARLGQESIAEAMRQRALGNAPTIASLEADRQSRQLAAEQSSIGASARGPAALALASQVAAQNTATGLSNISNAAQINAANERRQDEVAAFGAQTGLRQGDQSLQGQDAQQAQAQAAINAAQRQANDAYANANYGRSVDINKTQLDAQMHQVDTATGAATADKNRQSAEGMHDDDRTDKYIGIGAGAAATAGGLLLANLLGGAAGKDKPIAGPNSSGSSGGGSAPADGSLTPGTSGGTDGNGTYDIYKAKGGPVRMGRPYIVGEEGPELIIPREDGHVLTAPQTQAVRDLGEIDEPRDMGEIDEPTRDLGDVDTPRMRGPNARDLGEIDTRRDPVSFERHNSPWMDQRIAEMIASQKAQDTMLGEPSTARAIARVDDRHPLERENRVDAFLDGIHPLSYHYKDAAQEPRSQPTGGRYLGISAQDLEAVPDVGRQMVSNGPRGKQIEQGPTLSAALAGVARLNERVRELEGGGQSHRRAPKFSGTESIETNFENGDEESLGPSGAGNREYPDYNFIHSSSPLNVATALEADRAAITPRTEAYMRREGMWSGNTDALLRERGLLRGHGQSGSFASDIRAKADVANEGAMTSYRTPVSLPGPQAQLPGPQLPGPQAPAALPGPQRQLPGPQSPTLGSLYGQGTQLPGPQRALPGPQRTLPGPQAPTLANAYQRATFTSDIRAKGDVQSEGKGPLPADTTARDAYALGRAHGWEQQRTGKPIEWAYDRPDDIYDQGQSMSGDRARNPKVAASPAATVVVERPVREAVVAPASPGVYERVRPAVMMAKRRVEGGIDETVRRGADVYRAATGNAVREPTLANIDDGGR